MPPTATWSHLLSLRGDELVPRPGSFVAVGGRRCRAMAKSAPTLRQTSVTASDPVPTAPAAAPSLPELAGLPEPEPRDEKATPRCGNAATPERACGSRPQAPTHNAICTVSFSSHGQGPPTCILRSLYPESML